MDAKALLNKEQQVAVLKLPKLPKPKHTIIIDESDVYRHKRYGGFTKMQMQDYAIKAIARYKENKD